MFLTLWLRLQIKKREVLGVFDEDGGLVFSSFFYGAPVFVPLILPFY